MKERKDKDDHLQSGRYLLSNLGGLAFPPSPIFVFIEAIYFKYGYKYDIQDSSLHSWCIHNNSDFFVLAKNLILNNDSWLIILEQWLLNNGLHHLVKEYVINNGTTGN